MKKLIIKSVLFILKWAICIAFGIMMEIIFIATMCGDGNKGFFELFTE